MKASYKEGQIVYLRTDVNQYPRCVTAVKFLSGGSVLYDLTSETEASCHFECELSDKRDPILATTNFDNK